MIYTEDTDFSAIERAAWIAGNAQLAALAAAADDISTEAVQTREQLEKECEEWADKATKAEEALTELRAAVRERLEAVDAILAECQRISKRAELEAALQAAYNEVAN